MRTSAHSDAMSHGRVPNACQTGDSEVVPRVSRVPSRTAPEGEIPRRDARVTICAADGSRLRFESGALRALALEWEWLSLRRGREPASPREARREAGFVVPEGYPGTVTATRCTALFM